MLRSALDPTTAASLRPCRTIQQLAVEHEALTFVGVPKARLKRLAEDLTTEHAPPFASARRVRDRESVAAVDTIPTGLADLDWLVGGGLPTGQVTELFGSPGAGKTQLCLLACAAQAASPSGSALYIDTSGELSAKRLLGLLTATTSRGLPREESKTRLRDRVRTLTTTALPELLRELDALDKLMRQRDATEAAGRRGIAMAAAAAAAVEPSATTLDPRWARQLRLVVVDAVFSVCCGDSTESSDSAAGAQFAMIQARLRDLAARHGLAVLLTNAVSPEAASHHDQQPEARAPKRPALGRAWQHVAHQRLLVQEVTAQDGGDGNTRSVQLLRHPNSTRRLPDAETTASSRCHESARVLIGFGAREGAAIRSQRKFL